MSSPSTNHQTQTTNPPKVAIVCDWLTGIGGAERVVLELHRLYPNAPIYTSQYSPHKIDWFKDADVRTGWLQRVPSSLKKFLPVFRALWFSRLDLSQYDLVISSSGAEAKGVNVRSDAVHISYIHSPTHYYWIRYDDYLKNPGFGKLDWLARIGLKLLVGPLRKWDLRAASKPSYMIANSHHTQEMIKKYYHRESTVIHPPVDTDRFKSPKPSPAHEAVGTQGFQERHGFVTAGRQTPYKRIDLAVQACSELGLPLLVIGSGPDHNKLKRIAGKSVTFLRGKDDDEVAHYFQTSLAFIFPGLDDFGIVAVEAMAAGTPVIAYQAGGALDYVIDGKTGLFFKDQNVDSLKKALEKFSAENFNNSQIQKHAENFSIAKFTSAMKKFISEKEAR